MIGQGTLHLDLTFVPFPPLILGALYDLLVAPRRGPLRSRVKLGLLCVAQYFIDATDLYDNGGYLGITLIAVLVVTVIMPARTRSYAFAR